MSTFVKRVGTRNQALFKDRELGENPTYQILEPRLSDARRLDRHPSRPRYASGL